MFSIIRSPKNMQKYAELPPIKSSKARHKSDVLVQEVLKASVSVTVTQRSWITVSINEQAITKARINPEQGITVNPRLLILPRHDRTQESALLISGATTTELFHRQCPKQKRKTKKRTHLSQPNVPATPNRVRIADILVEVSQIGGRIIPVDRHEIDLAIVEQGKELREPTHPVWAVGDCGCTEGSAVGVWHHVSAEGVGGILGRHTGLSWTTSIGLVEGEEMTGATGDSIVGVVEPEENVNKLFKRELRGKGGRGHTNH